MSTIPDPPATSTTPAAAARASERDLSGRQVGDYRLLRKLGRGAMAEVYLAEQGSLERHVALKVLKSDLATDDTYVKRFHMEARAAASLVHPAIVQIYEVGCLDGVHFIAQEYVQGQNLAERLARQGPPEMPAAVRIMRQVAAALAKSAEQGIVHRDIKPENLMLSKTGEVKVADFGLARVTQHADNLRLTQVGVTMGSPLYMSPEQVQGRPLDPRSDIYSFGVTCYQMLAGRTPFTGDTAISVAVQHLKTEPERLENLRPDLPPGLCRIVHRMLAKDAADRYSNGMELLRDLRSLDLPGLNGDWPEELDQWNTAEMVALTSARTAATQQLAALMQTAELPLPIMRRRLFWVALASACLAGGFLAWPSREPSLLASARTAPGTIRRMDSAADQYFFAMKVGSEPAWKSVAEYFPADEQYVRLAHKQLADDYLSNNRLSDAMTLFEQFAALGDAEPEYRAYGLAGECVVLSQEGKTAAAAEGLQELWPLMARLKTFDPAMARRVEGLHLRGDGK
ncbi:MAG: serine/threonine protein kinase [Planctomycetia bacterium]|nr:serine/threonine protein kinase [Planctomycetia bacterium]